MPAYIFLLLVFIPLAGVTATPPATDPVLAPGLVNPGFHEQPTWFKNSFLDIREDVAEAHANGKRVLLYFYQDGCPYCKKLLETNFSQRAIVEPTRRYLDVIAINMWGDREVVDFNGDSTTEKEFAADLKVMFTPTMLFLNEQGEVLTRLNGYYPPHAFSTVVDYVGQRRESTSSLRDYAAKYAPPAAGAELHQDDSYLRPPYRLAQRASGKPLLVLFEQPSCALCDELHQDILDREESRALLSQFDVVLLDLWAKTPLETPDGELTTAVEWSRALNVQYAPTLIMFDSAGKEAFRTEAYLRAFHVQSSMDYVLSGAYREQPSFQRFVQARADAFAAQGVEIDLMD